MLRKTSNLPETSTSAAELRLILSTVFSKVLDLSTVPPLGRGKVVSSKTQGSFSDITSEPVPLLNTGGKSFHRCSPPRISSMGYLLILAFLSKGFEKTMGGEHNFPPRAGHHWCYLPSSGSFDGLAPIWRILLAPRGAPLGFILEAASTRVFPRAPSP
ncbi:hypothetical protein NPIL_623791 [Nephila pilipes]|uniref:Uncharacterized protein n=1 Tax=Nephila pilipes TaxID=299642 RepID=A0A8X6PP59_NEPPI|nr:hypothetical protein NPIL_623791 [Nephila pilipes]